MIKQTMFSVLVVALFAACTTKVYNNTTIIVPASPDAGATPSALLPDASPVTTVVTGLDAGATLGAEVAIDTTPASVTKLDSGTTSDALPANLVSLDTGAAIDSMPNLPIDSGSVIATDVGASTDATGTTSPSCQVAWSAKIADGTFGQTIITNKGFGIKWSGLDGSGNISYFRAYDWGGNPTSDQITLLNTRSIIGGDDGYLVSVVDDRGTAREWSVYPLWQGPRF